MASATSSTSKKKLKFLCSYGGKILPRPRDRKLRYVGGDTRIIRISQDCSWEDLNQELMTLYGTPHTVKYQLPGLGEDFHCLLEVSSDDDLEDLMEYGIVDGGEPEKVIRMFLFPLDGDDDAHLSFAVDGDFRSPYLSTVNESVPESHQNNASRAFHSEPSDPRAQAELQNRLSKAEAANRLDAAPRTQRSGPAALEDGLIEFEKAGERASLVAKLHKPKHVEPPSKGAESLHQPLSSQVENPNSKVEENLGESVSENSFQELTNEEDDIRIIDTPVGKAELSSMQVMDNKDLVELEKLGSGGFGTVYRGKWRGTNVAIKRINKSCLAGQPNEQDKVILDTFREAGLLANLHHPNIVSFYGFAFDEVGKTLAIVTELVVDGSLRNILLRKDKYLDYRKRLIIAFDAASGMEYLHLRKIIHFDLKCDNLLVDLKDPSRPVCKVTDFGLSKVKRDTLVSGGIRGTLRWMAPELLRGDASNVSEKVDVFSFGILMWEILTGQVPYVGLHEGQIIGGIFNNTLRPPVPASCDPKWRRLMEECWAFHPQQRPSFHQIAGRLHSMLVANHAEAASDVGGETTETQSENSLMLPDRQERERSGNANIVNWKRQKPLEGYPELPPPGNSHGVVLYTTTLGGVRRTFEACERARLVLEVHAVEAGVEVDKRDVWLHREFLKELRELLGMGVAVPQLFIRGKYIGGVDEIVELSEAGKLREMMKSG